MCHIFCLCTYFCPMIQRIQSVYLLIAGLIMLVLPFVSVASLIREGHSMSIFISGLLDEETGMMEKNLWQPTLCFMGSFISLWLIFLYKDRNRQQRIGRINFIINLLLAVTVPLTSYLQKQFSEDIFALNTPVIFPAISAILVFLAIRAIKKDEDLVRSADRIR